MVNFFRSRRRAARQRSATGEDDFARLEDTPADSDRVAQLTSVKRQNAHATLLDAMRAVAGKSQTPSIVVAGIAGAASANAVIEGVASQAALRGVRLRIGDVTVTQTHRGLSLRGDQPTEPELAEREAQNTTLPLELTAAAAQEALESWFVTAGAGFDLLIVAGPPILSSVDALLVARACDGLVLVAEPLGTQREEFESVVERARASGCQVLGLVMNENRDWLPSFVSRLFSSYPRSILSKADPLR